MSLPNLSTYGGFLHEVGYAGGIVDELNVDIMNFNNDGATAIDYGIAVARGALLGAKAIAADADKIIGISVRTGWKAAPGFGQANANVVNYAQNEQVPVLKHGNIYVVAFENVTAEDAAISITAQGGKIGGVTGGAAGAGRVAIPGATWQTTTVAGAVGVVRINL
jgi:hypothetical protein